MADYKKYNTDGRSSEDRALDKFAEMMIEKINTLQNDWKKPWFTEGSLTWPKNLSGREYNGMNAVMLLSSPKSIFHQLNTVAMTSLLRMSIMLWYIIRLLEAHTM